MGRLGALGSFADFILAGIFHGPVYMAFSTSYLSLSRRAFSSQTTRSSGFMLRHCSEMILATSGVCEESNVNTMFKKFCVSGTNKKNDRRHTCISCIKKLTLSPFPSFSSIFLRISLCLAMVKKMKADLKRLGAPGALQYLTVFRFLGAAFLVVGMADGVGAARAAAAAAVAATF